MRCLSEIGLIVMMMMTMVRADAESSSTSTSTTTSTSTSTTTTTSTTTQIPLTPTPKLQTIDGNLIVRIPQDKELYFTFENEDEELSKTTTLHLLQDEANVYADDRLFDAQVYADQLNQEMTRVVNQLGQDAAMDVDVEAVQDDLDSVKTDLQDLTKHVDDVKQDASDALDDFSTETSTSIRALKDDVNMNRNQIQTTANDASSARSQLETRVNAAINDATSSWQTKLTQAQQTLTSDLNGVRDTLTAKINTDVGGVQAEVNTLKTLTAQHTGQINNLTPRLKTAEDHISNLQGSVNSLNTLTGQNKVKAEAAQTSANEAKTSASTANLDLSKLTSAFNDAMCGTLTYTFVNSESGTCEAQNNPIVTRYFADSRAGTVNQWVPLGRKATYTKQGSKSDSVVLFHYQDSLGVHSDNSGSYHACTWRLKIGSTQYASLASHVASDTGWDIFPGRMTFPLELDAGNHVFEMEVHRRTYSSCLAGWANGQTENHMIFEEVHRDRIGFRTSFSDRRLTTMNAWYTIPDRELTYLKKKGDTDLHLFWTDVMGYSKTTIHTHSCHVRVLMSGPGFSGVHLGHNGAYSNAASGWKIRPRSLQYYLPQKNLNLQPGSYTFTAQFIRDSRNGAYECLQGWAQQLGNMVVVEKDPSSIAYAPSNLFSGTSKQSFPDHRVYGGFQSLSGRSVTHTKKSSTSLIRVTYMDTLGWSRASHSTACLFRLLVDGTPNSRYMWSHTSTFSSTWNIDPYSIVWMPAVAKGTHTYVIQMQKESGASECLAGWRPNTNEPQNNFMLVEEIEQNKGTLI